MILHSLYKLYDRLADDPSSGITALKFAPQKISFRVVIRPDGTLFSISPVSDSTSKKSFLNTDVPEHKVRSGTKILPQFLCDKATYSLGVDPKTGSRDGYEKHFDSFKDYHLAAEPEINTPQYSSFCRFLESWNSEAVAKFAKENPDTFTQCANFGIFEVQGEKFPLHEVSTVRKWWINQKADEAPSGQCLLTGETSPIARLHPKIKGFASAASLVGVQKGTSYESYNLEQAFTAPTSELAAFKYASSLNWLLDGKGRSKHRFYVGDTTCVFWTDKSSFVEDSAGFYFSQGSNKTEESQDPNVLKKIEIFLKSLRQNFDDSEDLGENSEDTNFYVLGLEQPNPGRFSIRFFMQSTVKDLLNNLRQHHEDISIVREYDKSTSSRPAQPEFPSNRDLINQTAVKLSSGKLDYKTIPPLLGGSLMRAILENTPYPEGIYSAVLRRIRADRTINYFRAAILKGTLTRNHKQTIPTMLDTENKEPAYLLGRLFSALEKTQGDALGDLNAGLKDKYYSSASATPSSVFPRILRTYPHHLAKLTGGQKVNRERLIQDVIGELSEFPSHLNLKDQGKFAIGYYHQRKDFFTKKTSDSLESQESK